jgi:hypothetical protein
MLVLLIMTVPTLTTRAQTEWLNNYKVHPMEEAMNPHIARPSRPDITITVWEEYVNEVWVLRAQMIDNEHGLPQWLPYDGVPVSLGEGNQRNPRAAYDSLGHVLITWEDDRSGSWSVYAQCLHVSDGSVHANWPQDGLQICDLEEDARHPRIAGIGDGAYIAWVDWRNSPPHTLNRDIFAVFVESQTASIPTGGWYQWQPDGLRVPFPPQRDADQLNVEIARDYVWVTTQYNGERDGVILTYEDRRDTSATTGDTISTVYATRFDVHGQVPWGDVRVAQPDEAQILPRIVVAGRHRGMGDHVAAVVWQDVREDPNYPTKWDIFGQTLDKHSGQLLGPADGYPICDHPETQRYPEIALYERPENPLLGIPYEARVTCVWEDLRDAGSQGVDLYCAVIDAQTGAHLNPGGPAGDVISIRNGDQTQARVDNFPDDDWTYFIWRDEGAGGGPADIWYQSLDQQTMQFSQSVVQGRVVAPAKDWQVTPQVGGSVFVWADYRRQMVGLDSQRDWNIYCETPGECVGDRQMKWRDMYAEVRQSADATDMHFVVDLEYNSLVVWEKGNGTDGDGDVYIQKLDVDGVPRWKNSGVKLNDQPGASHPRVARSDIDGGAQVVWQQPDNNGNPEIYYAKLDPMGAFAIPPERVGNNNLIKPVIAYAERTNENVQGNGEVKAYVAGIDPSPGNSPMVFSSLNRGSWLSRVASAGGTSGFPDGLLIDATDGGDVLLVGWEEEYSGGPTELLFLWALRGDAFLKSDLKNYAEFGGYDLAADIAGAPPYRGGFVVYCADSGNGTLNLRARHLEFQSNFLGIPFTLTNATGEEAARNPTICADYSVNGAGYGGMLVAWDWAYYDIPSQSIRHFVQTNKFEYWTAGQGTIQWSGPIIDVDAAWASGEPRRPDIARIAASAGVLDTLGFIVWEDSYELCSPARPREIVGQWVAYDTLPSPFSRGPQWNAPKMIGPGAGYYEQKQPMVHTSVDNTVNVFWLDGRASHDLVMGTRVWGEGSDAIFWGKDVAEEPPLPTATVRLGESFPQPLSLRQGGLSHIVIESGEATTVRLTIHDNLGRRVALVHEGSLPAGRQTLRFDASGLRPGMYHYVLHAGNAVTTRGLVIVR